MRFEYCQRRTSPGLSLEEALENLLDDDDDLVTTAESKEIVEALRTGRITLEELETSAAECEVGCVANAELLDGQAGLSALLSKSVTPIEVALCVPNWGDLIRNWTTNANRGARVLEARCNAANTKPLGGEVYPFGVRELSLLMHTDEDRRLTDRGLADWGSVI